MPCRTVELPPVVLSNIFSASLVFAMMNLDLAPNTCALWGHALACPVDPRLLPPREIHVSAFYSVDHHIKAKEGMFGKQAPPTASGTVSP
jgi:hypothetical protein